MSQEKWFNKKTSTYMNYKGRKNKLVDENKEFVRICKLTQKQLKSELAIFLFEQGYEDIHVGDGFIYAKGEIPFVLTAHMDTVHSQVVQTTYEFNKNGDYLISSPQGIGGDDRCGIYMIMNIIRKGYKPYIIFCEDEEVGCVGSKLFCKTNYVKELKDCKYFIELDRANSTDAVFYDCDNKEFTEFITSTTGYKKDYGSCSDISYLCPATKIAGVNLSCGYYNAHTLGEYVNMTEMNNTQKVVEKLLETECVQYEYIEREYYTYSNAYGDYSWIENYYGRKTYATETKHGYTYLALEVTVVTKDQEEDYIYVEGTDENECWVNFFFENPTLCFNNVLDWNIIQM